VLPSLTTLPPHKLTNRPYVRDAVLAVVLGAGNSMDAFTVAFRLARPSAAPGISPGAT